MDNHVINYLSGKGSNSSHIKIDDKDSGTSSVSPGLTPFFVNGDYDKLENTPIKNLTGKDTKNFVVLSGLDCGNYVLRGYFKSDPTSDIEYVDFDLALSVVDDLDSGNKVLYYTTIEGGESYINKIEYGQFGNVISVRKNYLEGIKWEDF